MLSARSSRAVIARARLESRARHDASASRVVTGAPSQKRASDRRVTVQWPSGPCSQDRASAGRTRPWQSTWISVSYRSEEHTSELQSRLHLVCRLLLEKKKKNTKRKRTSRTKQPST